MIAVMPVTTVLTILIALIVAAPVLMIVGSPFSEGFGPAIAAIAMALVALCLSADKTHRLATLLKPIVPVLLIPCAWILFQLVPVGHHWLAHPAWTSASTALGKPLPGTVSLDIGATLLSLARYLLIVAVAIVATAVALDRQHAKIVLYVLVAVAAAIAAALIGLSHVGAAGFDLAVQRPQMADIAMIGVILSCAATIHAYQSSETPPARRRQSAGRSIYAGALPLLAAAICLSAIIIDPDAALLPAAACGIGVLISVEAIRRLRLGPWGRSGVAAAAIVVLIGFFAINPIAKDTDPTLSLAQPSQGSVPIAERILADARWVGTGAGTFRALVPIYRDADDADTRAAPTAAAQVATEMGRPFFWTLVVLALIGAWMLFMRALTRGRDHLYAAAGAGCIVAVVVSAFGNAGAFGLITPLFIGTICGLALAQSKGWSALDLAIPGLKSPPDQERPIDRLRAGLLAFAAVLAVEAAWIIPAEYYRPERIPLPVDPQASRLASHDRGNTRRAASLAMVRGDLWADSAFTHADLLWKEPATAADDSRAAIGQSRADLEHALRYSPHRGDVWLMLAIMADRYNWPGYQPNALLKMSYLTAPSELSLFLLRIKASLRPDALKDPEIQDMARHDLRVIITRTPALKPALAAIYRASSADAKAFLDRAIMDIDPLYLSVMRADLQLR